MAENVEITAGTGTTVAADDVGGVKYQQVKLVDGTADSTTVVTGVGGRLAVNARPAEHANTMKHARVAMIASQTGATILDPTNGTKFVLHKMIVSASGAGTVRFFDSTDSGDTVIGPILSLAANGGWSETWDMNAPYRSATVNNILKYTSGSGFTGSAYLEYWEE